MSSVNTTLSVPRTNTDTVPNRHLSFIQKTRRQTIRVELFLKICLLLKIKYKYITYIKQFYGFMLKNYLLCCIEHFSQHCTLII